MNREERERMVDRLLNEALAPQEVEARPGLEDRILANLRAQPEPRPWWRWLWVPAAVTAAVLLALVLKPGRESRQVQAPVVVQRQPAPKVAPAPQRPAEPPRVAARVRPERAYATKVAAALPRQDVFPTPVPLTTEEKMLLTLTRRDPRQAVLVAREREMDWERILKGFEEEAAPKAESTR